MWKLRRPYAIAGLVLAPLLAGMGAGDDGRWRAGAYSYSDERGGFRIVAISGVGTEADPVEIVQQFDSASPATMVIRAEGPIGFLGSPSADIATGMIHIRLVTVNNSGLPWIEFELELRERVEEPSTYGDGLSFDQRDAQAKWLVSDSFSRYERDFEPSDVVVFTDGAVDAGKTGVLNIYITDFTRRWRFFVRQDPRGPLS